jgi:hypothetical protein
MATNIGFGQQATCGRTSIRRWVKGRRSTKSPSHIRERDYHRKGSTLALRFHAVSRSRQGR